VSIPVAVALVAVAALAVVGTLGFWIDAGADRADAKAGRTAD